jgi:hypothetical protein
MLTPCFHPNIEPATICVGDHWTAGERLVDLVVRIGEMITYQAYNIKSPLDGEAAMWADLHAASCRSTTATCGRRRSIERRRWVRFVGGEAGSRCTFVHIDEHSRTSSLGLIGFVLSSVPRPFPPRADRHAPVIL